MSNEGYWMIHEMGEEYRRKYIVTIKGRHNLYDSKLAYAFIDQRLKRSVNYLSLSCWLLIQALDVVQKRGRLIVGGKVSE